MLDVDRSRGRFRTGGDRWKVKAVERGWQASVAVGAAAFGDKWRADQVRRRRTARHQHRRPLPLPVVDEAESSRRPMTHLPPEDTIPPAFFLAQARTVQARAGPLPQLHAHRHCRSVRLLQMDAENVTGQSPAATALMGGGLCTGRQRTATASE
jgi:hypothetical protein